MSDTHEADNLRADLDAPLIKDEEDEVASFEAKHKVGREVLEEAMLDEESSSSSGPSGTSSDDEDEERKEP